MNKFSKETAITTLSPYLNTINECIRGGFQDFFKVNSSNDSLVKGTKASIIHDHTVSRVSEAFENNPKTKIFDLQGLILLGIEDQYLIRFKKLSHQLKPSNIPTQQQFNFNNQPDLPGMPCAPINLTAGYVPNQFWTAIESTHLIRQLNENLKWEHTFEEQTQSSIKVFPVQTSQTKKSSSRISKRKEAVKFNKKLAQ